jgi:hypothetical protein
MEGLPSFEGYKDLGRESSPTTTGIGEIGADDRSL